MAIRITKWIGSNGEVLFPLGEDTTYNSNNLVSTKGTYFMPSTEEIILIEAGNPMGLLLTLTYPATP